MNDWYNSYREKKNEKAGSFSHSNTTYRHRRNIVLRGRWRIRRSRKRPYLKERNDLFHKDTRNKPMEMYIEMMTRLESQEPDEPSTTFSSLLIVVFNCLHSAVSTIPSANLWIETVNICIFDHRWKKNETYNTDTNILVTDDRCITANRTTRAAYLCCLSILK